MLSSLVYNIVNSCYWILKIENSPLSTEGFESWKKYYFNRKDCEEEWENNNIKHPIQTDNMVKIIFVPKFHCEFSPIEGFRCFVKQRVRKYTD